ncbi:recombinase family protein [Boudabousia liubingyangii]|uniref:recombinase family protein n=1 Tax=Boudabousia liubingyangii TaxID=1921764 RepID=UPI00093BBB54|nr:recombinase family protein [Boudabousia liubingyangii]OKL48140.1 recombinase family protein [Boudabousia liubingyangii]
MAGRLEVITPTSVGERLRVAAYVRVSTEHERQLSSLSAQVSYYLHLIESTPGWEFAGIFSDEGATGTKRTGREGLADLMALARSGGVDVVLCKSISRLARNTTDLLEVVRELKSLGVTVRFERESIDTATAQGEVLLTLLAAFAQAESETNSANVKWGIRKKYADGTPHSRHPYGYAYQQGTLVVIEDEAVVVRRLFNNYLAGISPEKTAHMLNDEGVRPRSGRKFRGKTMRTWLENEVYAGRVVCQKYFRPHLATSTVKRNEGELDSWVVDGAHEPIIDPAIFDEVQQVLAMRRQVGRARTPSGGSMALTSKITCTVCSKHFHRRTKTRSGTSHKFWWCYNATRGQGNPCQAPRVREEVLKHICQDALGLDAWDEEAVITGINTITISPDRSVCVELAGGSIRRYQSDGHPSMEGEVRSVG